MTPFYQDEWLTLFCGDAEQLLPSLLGREQVLITDPPYGRPYHSVLTAAVRLSTSAAVYGYPEELIAWCVRDGLVPREWITWYPRNKPGNSGKPLPKQCECIALFGYLPGAQSVFRERRDRNPQRALARNLDPLRSRLGDVWETKSPGLGYGEDRTERVHPNQKPFEDMKNLVAICSEVSVTVVDPYCGSGTTPLACKALRRKCIAIEKEESNCNQIVKRVRESCI